MVACSHGVAMDPVIYCEEQAVERFLELPQDQLTEIQEVFRCQAKVLMNENNWKAFIMTHKL